MIQDIAPHNLDIAYIDAEPDNDSAILFFHDSYLLVGRMRDRENITFPTYGEVRDKCEKLVYLFRLDGRSFFYYNVDENEKPQQLVEKLKQVLIHIHQHQHG